MIGCKTLPGYDVAHRCKTVAKAPYVRSVGHVFAYLYTLDDDTECPMDYETSLLHKVLPIDGKDYLDEKVSRCMHLKVIYQLQIFWCIH